MSQGGYVTLIGFVATEPRINQFSDGTDVANLRIGSSTRKLDRETGEWHDGELSFYSVRCRKALARNAKICLRKGQPIVVAGKLHIRSYQDRNGQQRSDVEVWADTIGYDLARGTAHFSWSQRSSADSSALAHGEAIRAGLEDEDSHLAGMDAGHGSGMFDEQAIADLDHELDESAAEPAAG
jgi:single stranded DNA-binding protein